MNTPPQPSSTRTEHPDVPFVVVSDMTDGHLAVGLSGELDLACSDLLASDGHEGDTSIHDVTLDIEHLEFIDTAGVRALIGVRERHEDAGRTVHLVRPADLVRKVVDLYGRSDVLAG